MWILNNTTPFACSASFQRTPDLSNLWCVWIKARFQFRHALPCMFVQAPDALLNSPFFDGEELLADSDFSLPKSRTDIIVHAKGCPPDNRARTPYIVSSKIGDWSKRLVVHPALLRDADGRVRLGADDREHRPRIGFSQSWGGRHTDRGGRVEFFPDNPIGMGYSGPGNTHEQAPLPRVTFAGERPETAANPAGFLPIPSYWPERARLAGTFDEAWQRHRAPLPPSDQVPDFHQSAPRDQQYDGHLKGGETVELTNIVPQASGQVQFQLPSLQWDIQTHFRGTWVKTQPRPQTLHIDAEESTLDLTWLAALDVGASEHDIHVRESRISLSGRSGFNVRPEDAHLFQDSRSGQA